MIDDTMRAWYQKMIQATSDVTKIDAIGKFFYVMLAGYVFGNEETKKKYDKDGDPIISRVSSTIKYKDPEFYKNHCLYEVAGAQKDDDYEHLTNALKKSVYRVLQDQRNRYTKQLVQLVDVEAAEHFKWLWFCACHILTNKTRRYQYDTAKDTNYGFHL